LHTGTTFVHIQNLAAALDLLHEKENAKQPLPEGADFLIIDKKYMKEFKDTYLEDMVPLAASLRFHIVLLLNYVDLGSIPFFTESGVICLPDPASHDNLVNVLNGAQSKAAAFPPSLAQKRKHSAETPMISLAKRPRVFQGRNGSSEDLTMVHQGKDFEVKATTEVEEEEEARWKILVVEDNSVNQLVIVGLLKKMGHVPVIASSGQEGFDAFKSQTFDVVLMVSSSFLLFFLH